MTSVLNLTPELLPQMWQQLSEELLNHDPKLSPLRAGELAAARLCHQMRRTLADLEDHLFTGLTQQEVNFYDLVNVDEWNFADQLVDLSKSRTLVSDVWTEYAKLPLDAAPLQSKFEAQRNGLTLTLY